MKSVISILTLLMLVACTTNPKTVSEYWYGLGERLGNLGYSDDIEELNRYKEQIPFDEKAFQEGYTKGKAKYCEPSQAFNKGISGIRYTGQCEGSSQEAMIESEWRRGWDAFIGADFY